MSGVYVDSSALVKLVVEEPDSSALRTYLQVADHLYASHIASVEVRRAVRRHSAPAAMDQAELVLETIRFIELDEATARAAGTSDPLHLRTLDAIHLGAALELGDECAAFVSYDARLNAAAEAAGLTVSVPH